MIMKRQTICKIIFMVFAVLFLSVPVFAKMAVLHDEDLEEAVATAGVAGHLINGNENTNIKMNFYRNDNMQVTAQNAGWSQHIDMGIKSLVIEDPVSRNSLTSHSAERNFMMSKRMRSVELSDITSMNVTGLNSNNASGLNFNYMNHFTTNLIRNASVGLIPGLTVLNGNYFNPFGPNIISNFTIGLTPAGTSFGSILSSTITNTLPNTLTRTVSGVTGSVRTIGF